MKFIPMVSLRHWMFGVAFGRGWAQAAIGPIGCMIVRPQAYHSRPAPTRVAKARSFPGGKHVKRGQNLPAVSA